MLTSLLALLCTQVALATSPPIPHPQDVARRDKLRRMLSIRDSTPACATLSPISDRLVTDLQWLMDHVEAPPWVGVRAAQCIMQLHGENEIERIKRWVQDPDKKGLVLVVLGEIDELAPLTARTIVEAALIGPHNDLVLPRIEKSIHPEVRALVQVPEVSP